MSKEHKNEHIISLPGMYKEYFLDYASYVILERAVPGIKDGLKPVQRRILHSMKTLDDGRYHKVANIIGNTMQYHPHGDAAIGDALVNLGQKELLIDCQGNWGDYRTGDSAAAPRYIEARLTKFALAVAFNAQTTEWQVSYDGRKKEPVDLPMKFPLLLSQGVEGIAVGLSTKIMPHNFIELIQGSIKILQGKKVKIYPDFLTGGMVDVEEYNGGKRGGKIKVRAKIAIVDKKHIAVKELPYGITTNNLIESIVKANDKGQIKIKKVVDNTAKEVEILIELASGISPEVTMDALYAFTNCEVSISPNACVIIENKPHFMDVNEVLELSTHRTKELLRQELEIKKAELLEKWHFSSLEKIFIEKRIYRDIEECESWEEVLEAIRAGLIKYVATPETTTGKTDKRLQLHREITEEDIAKLTEIKIKRISKYNVFKADELIKNIEEELEQVFFDLKNLTDFTIHYFEDLLEKFGKGKERRTEITSFEAINTKRVVANNARLYANFKEGFIGIGLKKDEFISECSDIDDIISFRKDGVFNVNRISDKVFVGKDMIHCEVWRAKEERHTYNMIYVDGKSGKAFAKRFNVTSITRAKDYDLTTGTPGSKVLYFTSNPNGEAEIVSITLSPGCPAKKKLFEFDFSELAIKGRSSKGNTVTKYPIKKISLSSAGKSTLGAMRLWMDEVSGRLNREERGVLLGEFDTGNLILAIYKDGSYEQKEPNPETKFDVNDLVFIGKFDPEKDIQVVYYEGEKKWTMVKRFIIETNTLDQRFHFLTDARSTDLIFAKQAPVFLLEYSYKVKGKKEEDQLNIEEFVDIKGWKALGNKLIDGKISKIREIETAVAQEERESPKKPDPSKEVKTKTSTADPDKKETPKAETKPTQASLFDDGSASKENKDDDLSTGDTIEFDID